MIHQANRYSCWSSFDIKQSRNLCFPFAVGEFHKIDAPVFDREPSQKSKTLQGMGDMEGKQRISPSHPTKLPMTDSIRESLATRLQTANCAHSISSGSKTQNELTPVPSLLTRKLACPANSLSRSLRTPLLLHRPHLRPFQVELAVRRQMRAREG